MTEEPLEHHAAVEEALRSHALIKPSLPLWEAELRSIYDRMSRESEPYSVDVSGLRILVTPGVFSPKYISNTAWFAPRVAALARGNRLLEVGVGTGAISLLAALNGAVQVWGTDINEVAISNAQRNFRQHGAVGQFELGDVFEPIPRGKRFDCLFWNHPFNKGRSTNEPLLLRSGFDYRYRALTRYLSNANSWLTPNGLLLLGTGNHADLPTIMLHAHRGGLQPHLLARANVRLNATSSADNDYRIYAFCRRNNPRSCTSARNATDMLVNSE